MSTAAASSAPSAFVGSIPELYDRHLGPVIFEPYAQVIAAMLARTGAERVLETACGTGIVTRRMLEVLPAGASLVATDLNAPMIDYARKRLATDPRLAWRVADAQALSFGDGAFDALVCQFGIMFFPDKPLAMREARRVLAPGGTLLVSTWDGFEANAFGRIAHETITGFFPTDPPQFYATPFGWRDDSVMRETVEGAGFRGVTIEAVERTVTSVSAADFAIGLVRGNPVINTISERGSVSAQGIQDEVARRLAAEFGNAPCRVPTRIKVISAKA